jgi:hypothetical protein
VGSNYRSAAKRRDDGSPKGFLWGAATDGWVLEHMKRSLFAEPSADADSCVEDRRPWRRTDRGSGAARRTPQFYWCAVRWMPDVKAPGY